MLTPIFDGHNDTLLRVARSTPEQPFSFFAENSDGHLDLPRARRGGLIGGIFAIYTPLPPEHPERAENWGLTIFEGGYRQVLNSALDPEYARLFTEAVMDRVDRLVAESGGQVRLARSAAEIERCRDEGALALVLHLEGAEAVRPDLSNLQGYYGRGLRSIGVCWSRPNAFANGVPFEFPASPDTGPGLTAAGKDLLRECNRLRILVDLAHINERGFWDAAEISSAPLVVSHADAHALLPATRNLTDAQIDAVGRTGGIIGLNFEPMNIGENGQLREDVPLANLVRHVDYIANRIGVDHVGFGSDFDGTTMPTALGDAAGLQNLVQALRDAGYGEEDIEKIACKNWLRVLRETWGV